jgi:hypothetical protein
VRYLAGFAHGSIKERMEDTLELKTSHKRWRGRKQDKTSVSPLQVAQHRGGLGKSQSAVVTNLATFSRSSCHINVCMIDSFYEMKALIAGAHVVQPGR